MLEIDNKIKIIFCDIDGTLTTSKKEITQRTKKVIKDAVGSGIYVVLCSGRVNNYVAEKSIETNASQYAISSGGSLVYDFKDNISIFKEKIDEELIKIIWKYAKENKVHIGLNGKNNRYINNIQSVSKIIEKSILIENFEQIEDDEITQIIIESHNFNAMIQLEQIVTKNGLYIPNQSIHFKNKEKDYLKGFCFDTISTKANKGIAIDKLLKYLKIDKKNAICFGDSEHDSKMFEACGYKVAMENASESIKKMADFITLSNDEDGVADFIENNILNQK